MNLTLYARISGLLFVMSVATLNSAAVSEGNTQPTDSNCILWKQTSNNNCSLACKKKIGTILLGAASSGEDSSTTPNTPFYICRYDAGGTGKRPGWNEGSRCNVNFGNNQKNYNVFDCLCYAKCLPKSTGTSEYKRLR
jgi:hypothetical protein